MSDQSKKQRRGNSPLGERPKSSAPIKQISIFEQGWNWHWIDDLPPISFVCGHCNSKSAGSYGACYCEEYGISTDHVIYFALIVSVQRISSSERHTPVRNQLHLLRICPME